MKPFSAITTEDLVILTRLARAHPVFRVYLADARAATDGGATDRTVMLSRSGHGAVLGIAFDRFEVRTVMGALEPDEEHAAAELPRPGSLHVDHATADRIRMRIAGRLTAEHELEYYLLDHPPAGPPDPRCVRLADEHFGPILALFEANYPETIFSRWMLQRLFLGVFENDRLMACGGVIGEGDGVANIGNFLTAPHSRGRGLCRAIAATLAHRLLHQGVTQVTLGTTADNPAARQAYMATGFRCFDRRVQIELT